MTARAPISFAPRLMQATAAAQYIGVSHSKFLTLGIPSKIHGGNRLWDRIDLDAFADGLPYATAERKQEREAEECDAAFGMTG
jgi:hypothetical protein